MLETKHLTFTGRELRLQKLFANRHRLARFKAE
jgi:hypothetical protein